MAAAPDATVQADPLADPANRQRLDLARAFAFQLLKGIKQIGMYRHNEARYGEYLEKAHEIEPENGVIRGQLEQLKGSRRKQ